MMINLARGYDASSGEGGRLGKYRVPANLFADDLGIVALTKIFCMVYILVLQIEAKPVTLYYKEYKNVIVQKARKYFLRHLPYLAFVSFTINS